MACDLQVGFHSFGKQQNPDDYLLDKSHCEHSGEQLLNSVNSADNAGEDSQ